jgi:hypothetical protein
MTIQRGGKKEGAGKRGGKVDKTPPHPPHDMKRAHRSVNWVKGKKYVSEFFECQFPGCNEKSSNVRPG